MGNPGPIGPSASPTATPLPPTAAAATAAGMSKGPAPTALAPQPIGGMPKGRGAGAAGPSPGDLTKTATTNSQTLG